MTMFFCNFSLEKFGPIGQIVATIFHQMFDSLTSQRVLLYFVKDYQ